MVQVVVRDQSFGQKNQLTKITDEALASADDGELFLESVKSESLLFDNNAIKAASYNVSGGFEQKNIDVFLLLEYMKYRPTFYTNLFWISRHRDADQNDPFLYPRVDGSDVDNIHIFNDLAFNLFSSDIGTRFALGRHKYKLQYNKHLAMVHDQMQVSGFGRPKAARAG